MTVSGSFLAHILDLLGGLGRVRSRRMFGGIGLYCDDLFFALIDDDTLYLRVDDSTRADFVGRGLRPFQPIPDKPGYSMSYYQAPTDALEDAEVLVAWARKALRVAEVARKPAAPGVRSRTKTSRPRGPATARSRRPVKR